jgi:ATP-dependent DNA helicase RecG
MESNRLEYKRELTAGLFYSNSVSDFTGGVDARKTVRGTSRFVTARVEARVRLESETSKVVLLALVKQPLQRAEVARVLGHDGVSGAINRSIKELLSKQLIEYTIPDKPNSRLQKYRLTARGQALLVQLGE